MKKIIKIFVLAIAVTFLVPSISAQAAINSLNGQTGNTQTFVNETNLKITSATNTHTLGWQGLLSIARGGTNNSSFTKGSVLYFDGAKFNQDNNNFYWASSSMRLGLGTKTPGYRLDVQGGQVNASGGLCIAGDCRTGWPASGIQTLNGLTATSQTFMNDSNVIISSTGSGHTLGWSGLLPISRGGTNSSTFTAGSITFFDGSKLTENNSQFYWDNINNRLGIGTTNPLYKIDVNGDIRTAQVVTNTISATGANQSLSLNPSGTGKVIVGGDSIVVSSKSSEPANPKAGQIYFDSTRGKFMGYNGVSWVILLDATPTPVPTPTPTPTPTVSALVVAGGGGGGTNTAGGGGAGGYQYNPAVNVTTQTYAVTVGDGGVSDTNGSDSSFDVILIATGGGHGGAYNGGAGTSGGSGGGGAYLGGAGASGIGGQGNSGGNAASSASGGGGGSSAAGGNGHSGPTSGDGGAGTTNSISGSSVTYAGGGGGGGNGGVSLGSGGSGGGGNGATDTPGASGTANTGGGGGGGGGQGSTHPGGAGGSGIVIISYPTGSLSATGGTITTSGGNTIHTFTSSGTFTVTSI